MKYINLFEKFTESDYSKTKEKKEKKYSEKLINKLGNKYIVNIVAEGDFDGLNYLLSTGYDLRESGNLEDNLLIVALQNKQMEMFEWLLKSDYVIDLGYDNPIDCIHLPDIVGSSDYKTPMKVTPEMIEILKIIADKGYNFGGDHNLIELYLTENKYEFTGKNERGFFDGLEPFIEWLLENYPENYKLCKPYLSDNLKDKFKYFEDSEKYNM